MKVGLKLKTLHILSRDRAYCLDMHMQKNLLLIVIIRNKIVFDIFRLIWKQYRTKTEFILVDNSFAKLYDPRDRRLAA